MSSLTLGGTQHWQAAAAADWPGALALALRARAGSSPSGTLVPYDIIYDLTLSFTGPDIIFDIIQS
jgi:hypothetical protein